MRSRRVIAISVLCMSVSGCAGPMSTITLAPESEQRLRTTTISPEVKVGPFVYFGPELAIPFAGPALNREEGRKLHVQLQQHGINVGEIVRTAFVKQLRARPEWAVTLVDEGGDATFHIEIRDYGVAARGFYWTGPGFPFVAVIARLNDSKGIVWQRSERVTHLSDQTTSYSIEEYFRNADAARTAFESAAEVVVGKLWAHLSSRSR